MSRIALQAEAPKEFLPYPQSKMSYLQLDGELFVSTWHLHLVSVISYRLHILRFN